MNKCIKAALILSAATPCVATADGNGDLPYKLNNKYITNAEASPTLLLLPSITRSQVGTRHKCESRACAMQREKAAVNLSFTALKGSICGSPAPTEGYAARTATGKPTTI